MAQNSGFVPQITLTDFAESYIRKKAFKHYRARALLWVIYIHIYYPHCIVGVLKYPRSQIGAMSEARSYCGITFEERICSKLSFAGIAGTNFANVGVKKFSRDKHL